MPDASYDMPSPPGGWSSALGTAAPYIAAGLSTYGQIDTNQKNLQIARENQAFQERMSSTAAQRSVNDYRAAGLNPALAYDRSASSPSGATATMGNAIASGVSTAASFAALKMAKQQNEADLQLKSGQRLLLASQAAKTMAETEWEKNLRVQTHAFNAANQPADLRRKLADALLRELEIPGARNEAAFQRSAVGKYNPYLRTGVSTAKDAMQLYSTFKRSPLQRY